MVTTPPAAMGPRAVSLTGLNTMNSVSDFLTTGTENPHSTTTLAPAQLQNREAPSTTTDLLVPPTRSTVQRLEIPP
jgi:hypothetical protein